MASMPAGVIPSTCTDVGAPAILECTVPACGADARVAWRRLEARNSARRDMAGVATAATLACGLCPLPLLPPVTCASPCGACVACSCSQRCACVAAAGPSDASGAVAASPSLALDAGGLPLDVHEHAGDARVVVAVAAQQDAAARPAAPKPRTCVVT